MVTSDNSPTPATYIYNGTECNVKRKWDCGLEVNPKHMSNIRVGKQSSTNLELNNDRRHAFHVPCIDMWLYSHSTSDLPGLSGQCNAVHGGHSTVVEFRVG